MGSFNHNKQNICLDWYIINNNALHNYCLTRCPRNGKEYSTWKRSENMVFSAEVLYIFIFLTRKAITSNLVKYFKHGFWRFVRLIKNFKKIYMGRIFVSYPWIGMPTIWHVPTNINIRHPYASSSDHWDHYHITNVTSVSLISSLWVLSRSWPSG